MSFMENHVLAYKAPLYGRRTAQLKIIPFDFFESRSCFKSFSDLDVAVIYGIVGGTPQYLMQMNDVLSLEANIKRCFLDTSNPLFEEPNNLLKQEVREQATYNAIISAIATGSTKLSEIATKIGEETSACAAYIRSLISLGIVRKETPIAERSSRKTIYSIDDNLFRFWYCFIPDNIASINRGMADAAYERIAPKLSEYMGAVFEDICKQYLWSINAKGDCQISFTELGRWWGNDPKNKCEAEIDIMGVDGRASALFCECKWTNEKVEVSVLDKLVERSQLFHFENTHFYIFAKTGFTKGCSDKAALLGNVTLVTYDEVVRHN